MTAPHPAFTPTPDLQDDRELSPVEQARVLNAVKVMDDVTLLLDVERLTWTDLEIAYRALEKTRQALLAVGRSYKARTRT